MCAKKILKGFLIFLVILILLSWIMPVHTVCALFYNPGCPYCKPLMPLFSTLQYAPLIGKKVIMVDTSKPSELAERIEIDGVPTMLALDARTGAVLAKNEDRSTLGILSWVAF